MKGRDTISMIWNRVRSSKGPAAAQASETEGDTDLIYAVGDIHGRLDLLVGLLEKIILDRARTLSSFKVAPKSFIVFLGDYIDRGHSSKQVIEYLNRLDIVGSELIFLKGNHEQVALEFLDLENLNDKWLSYGGIEALASYGLSVQPGEINQIKLVELKKKFKETLPDHHLRFLEGLHSYWVRGKYMFVHAGVKPGEPLLNQTDMEYLWIREEFLDGIQKLPLIIVHGHTPESSPVWDGRRIGVDTGAYISNKLTAVKLLGGSVNFIST